MRAGQLRHRIDIQAPDGGLNSFREPTGAWSTQWRNVPACVEELSGRELVAAQQIVALATHKVTIRYLAGVTAKHRVLFEGRVLDIQAPINPDTKKIQMDLLCVERVGEE